MDEGANVERLQQALMGTTYGELFEVLVADKETDLLRQPDSHASLRKIVRNTAVPTQARFLASELLFGSRPDFPSAEEMALLPPIYAWALANQPTGNMWGLPGDDDGQAGMHVVKIGRPMIPALTGLFQDDRLLPFGGSIEATAANLWQVRVKDVAASLVSRIVKQQFPKQADPKTRDAFIQELEASVRN